MRIREAASDDGYVLPTSCYGYIKLGTWRRRQTLTSIDVPVNSTSIYVRQKTVTNWTDWTDFQTETNSTLASNVIQGSPTTCILTDNQYFPISKQLNNWMQLWRFKVHSIFLNADLKLSMLPQFALLLGWDRIWHRIEHRFASGR